MYLIIFVIKNSSLFVILNTCQASGNFLISIVLLFNKLQRSVPLVIVGPLTQLYWFLPATKKVLYRVL